MGKKSKTLVDRIAYIEQVYNEPLKNPELSKLLFYYGYGEKAFAEGEALIYDLKTQMAENLESKNSAMDATKNFKEGIDKIKKLFSKDRELAKIQLKRQPADYKFLKLNLPIPTKYGQLILAAKNFYTKILDNPQFSKAMAEFNLREDYFKKSIELIESIQFLKWKRRSLKLAAQNSTAKRKEALYKTEEWCRVLNLIKKIAIKSSRERLTEQEHLHLIRSLTS